MLILTEKSSVANDFALALNCPKRQGYYSDGTTEIVYCVGHLFRLKEPEYYDDKFRSWKEIPCIPESFSYAYNPTTKAQARTVIEMLKKHKADTILIATDADREGEIIARECLKLSGLTDFYKIKRFWVSQALTKDVVLEGINNARPFTEYDKLGKNGFARQHSDWLCGINFTRYVSVAANKKLSIGRVKTALLSAIDNRCTQIENFESKKYFEHYGIFRSTISCNSRHILNHYPEVRGIYFESENLTGFNDDSRKEKLKACIGKTSKLIDSKIEKKVSYPPQLYNLNAVQKDAFKYFGYSADKTLGIIQSLYEDLKCVSYPRTPSRVMGSGNIELCKTLADALCKDYSNYDFDDFRNSMNISLSNKRCFDDAKLEAHHALIPLKKLPQNASDEQNSIYTLILIRFFIAFLPEEQYEKQTYILDVDGNRFRITGKKIFVEGWKNEIFQSALNHIDSNYHIPLQDENEEDQFLEDINWNELKLADIETKEKWTKPPKYFNEASILSFMENPKNEDDSKVKLVGLGTQATRHTFIPELVDNGYIKIEKKNIMVTDLGKTVINAVRNSSIKTLADTAETTNWEKELEENPEKFEADIKDFVAKAVVNPFRIELPQDENRILCPLCKKRLIFGTTKSGYKNWYCSGYKEGCQYKIWESFNGTKLNQKDVSLLCSGKHTQLKSFTSQKSGKEYKARLFLSAAGELKMDFDK